jgi:hypothetical protein
MTRLLGCVRLTCMGACLSALCACAPEVGSERWCEVMQDRPRGDWSTNDALDYTRYCIFDRNDE